ncbi:MAG: hypothetical protein AAF511_11735 [Pseudomonadota bacterium]
MAVVSLPPTGFNVLRALDTYRFLTVSQMLRLGVANDPGNLRKVLGRMVSARRDANGIPRQKEIGVLDFGVLPRIGRLSRLYFLAPEGAALLAEADRDRPDPKPVLHAVRFRNDYFHRVNTIDFHITLSQFAEANGHEITLTRQYFNRLPKTGNTPPRPSTSIDLKPGYIDPDSIYMLRDPDGTERLLLVEIANGHQVDRVVKKLPLYGKALAQDKINHAFDYGSRAPRVLWLFDQPRTLELVQQRAADDDWAQASMLYFFMRPLAETTPDSLCEQWQRPLPDRDRVSLF